MDFRFVPDDRGFVTGESKIGDVLGGGKWDYRPDERMWF
jgi:hypothetical protein